MYLRLNVFDKPYSVIATSADGELADVFGPSARRFEWWSRDGGGPPMDWELVGEHDGRPVMMPAEDAEAFVARHGLVPRVGAVSYQ